MIVIDDVVHRTGTNVKDRADKDEVVHEIPLSRFKVKCKTKGGEPWGQEDEFDAVDEGDAIAKYIKKYNIKLASSEKNTGSSRLKFYARAVKEQRQDVLEPPEPKIKMPKAPKKAPAKKSE